MPSLLIWRDRIFVRFGGLILEVCILLWLFLIPFLEKILNHRKAYYEQLEQAQKGELDITPWIEWFLHTLKSAIEEALVKTERVVRKMRFWNQHRTLSLNDRQRKVLNLLLDGFEGKLNSSKWYKINHCSQDTANRDINDLIAKHLLRSTQEGGRSTNYELVEK